jgi:hypothetical protein
MKVIQWWVEFEGRRGMKPGFVNLYPSSQLKLWGYFDGFPEDAGKVYLDTEYGLCSIKFGAVFHLYGVFV